MACASRHFAIVIRAILLPFQLLKLFGRIGHKRQERQKTLLRHEAVKRLYNVRLFLIVGRNVRRERDFNIAKVDIRLALHLEHPCDQLDAPLQTLFEASLLAASYLFQADELVLDGDARRIARKSIVTHVWNGAELVDVILQPRLDVLDVGVVEVLDEPFGTAFPIDSDDLVAAKLCHVLSICATHALEDEIGIREVLHIVERQALRLVVGIHERHNALKVTAPRLIVRILDDGNAVEVVRTRFAAPRNLARVVVVARDRLRVVHVDVIAVA